ncbi:MAG: 4Fe-4S binding protein [Candidatus Polarisedimenticolia bacterium]|nr:4Fe-4S binding protein [bacterium]
MSAPDRAQRRPRRLARTFRRVYQAYFLLLFALGLFLMTDEGLRRFPARFLYNLDPLAAFGTLAASWVLPAALLTALLLVLATVLFGRVFCGWICPLGTLNHLASYLSRPLRRGPGHVLNRWRPLFRTKYFLLVAGLGAALAGGLTVALFDPLSLATRSFGAGLFAAARAAAPATSFRPRVFIAAWLTAALFLALLAANRWIARWWCRVLCPLGALLGWTSRVAIFRIAVDPDRCNHCRACARDCQGADEPWAEHRVSECHVCLNCVASCPSDAIRYAPFARTAAPNGGVQLERRQLLGALVAGAALTPLLRASAGAASSPGPQAIRPPGALPEEEFLARCVRCGACVNACPTSALQPAMGEAGLEGLWTPVLVPRRGWCEPSCTRCGHACPTGAIRPLAPDEKGWTHDHPGVKIGTAFYDYGRCFPWAMATPCIVCEEVCPSSPKAIWFERAQVVRRDGSVVALQRPHVDPARCVGCGLCEAKCPVNDLAAIRVTRVGESRDPRSSLTLKGSA